jgi:chemotaxis signal transduction protein
VLALLPLRIDGAWLAIDAAVVVELVGARPRTRLPDAPALAPAVVVHRGRAVPALDLGLLLGRPAAPAGAAARRRTVIVAVGPSTLALPVDAAREVLEVDARDLGPAPAGLQRWAARAVTLDDGPAPVLDLALVIAALAGAD